MAQTGGSGGGSRARTNNNRESPAQDAGAATPELSLEDGAGSLGIGLKDGAAPAKASRGGGVRSPLIDKSVTQRPAQQQAPQSQQQQPSRAVTGRRPAPRP